MPWVCLPGKEKRDPKKEEKEKGRQRGIQGQKKTGKSSWGTLDVMLRAKRKRPFPPPCCSKIGRYERGAREEKRQNMK